MPLTFPYLPPGPWTYARLNGAYVVYDAQHQDVLVIPIDNDPARAIETAQWVCDARGVA